MSEINDNSVQNILIDLDVFLDTRLASLSRVNSEVAVHLLKNGYRDRTSDIWSQLPGGAVGQDEYEQVYESRDKSILKQSRLTGFMSVLLDIVKEFDLT